MIQRIQSLYLLLAAVSSGVLTLFLPLWKNADVYYLAYNGFSSGSTLLMILAVFFILSSVLSIISFINFKNRLQQFMLGRLNIILNLIILGILSYYVLNLSGEMEISEKGIGSGIPLVTIILLAIANRSIKKDEDLVKSVDRIR
ncbi:DUF4293 domain-containing protein [Aureivirga sp. CE67]|uniref:DUF4293 domain-containing protein n=1 Tax=Aureivirga sp. CE67 TaxID=1788983 RepID=UPI0018CB4A59|nr:DUF4293 domain-containing protein [Aureivirga sp. CE67]